MLTLVYKTRKADTEYSTAVQFTDYNACLNQFYAYLAAVTADNEVLQFDIVILNSILVPCKTEHFTRETITDGAACPSSARSTPPGRLCR